jgi:glycosyltransferase involved in cell wall biosynthesis
MNILMTLANPFTHDHRVYNEAKSLVDAGHNVTILAWDKTGKHPEKETKDGISIVRSYNSGFMDFLPYDIFCLHWWWRKGCKDAVKLFEETLFDVIHCHDLSSLPIGVKLKKKFDVKLVYDAHEIWGFMVKKDLFWWKYYVGLEKNIIHWIDALILAEDSYKDYFNLFTDKKMVSILNCKPLQMTDYKASHNSVFTLLYIGTISPPRFLVELAEVTGGIENVRCIIAGGGKKEYLDKVKSTCDSFKNVDFIGKVSPEDVIPKTMQSDVIVCMIDPSNFNNKIATANKQFEAMVCGRPIICTKGTRSGEITKQYDCGLVIEYSEDDLRKAIIKLRDSPELREKLGKNGLQAAIHKYNWGNQEKKLLNVYKNLVMVNK